MKGPPFAPFPLAPLPPTRMSPGLLHLPPLGEGRPVEHPALTIARKKSQHITRRRCGGVSMWAS
jgi:hypothetical protein